MKKIKKIKMTLDRLCAIIQRDYSKLDQRVRNVEGQIASVKTEIGGMKTEIVTEISKNTIQSNDKVITKLDAMMKEDAAHTLSHKRINDTLLDHESRLKKVETSSMR